MKKNLLDMQYKKLQKEEKCLHCNWFYGCKISFLNVIMYCDLGIAGLKQTSIRWYEKELNICEKSVLGWKSYMREICSEFLLSEYNKKKKK